MIEIFGTKPFSPEQKEERVTYTDKQREIDVYERSEKSQLINHYIHGRNAVLRLLLTRFRPSEKNTKKSLRKRCISIRLIIALPQYAAEDH